MVLRRDIRSPGPDATPLVYGPRFVNSSVSESPRRNLRRGTRRVHRVVSGPGPSVMTTGTLTSFLEPSFLSEIFRRLLFSTQGWVNNL